MNICDLFSGVAVVIDDEIFNADAKIAQIVSQLEEKNVPVLKYKSIPCQASLEHLRNISFVLLDWRLIKSNITTSDISDGVTLPAELEKYDANSNVEFIKALNAVCFCPIFIFTNESVDEIITILKTAEIYSTEHPNTILIKSKADIVGENGLFLSVEEWLTETPSIYVLKEWEKEYQKSKCKLFSDMQKISSWWPCLLWKNYEEDGAIQSLELGELITLNLHTRMAPFNFDGDLLNKDVSSIPPKEVQEVLEGERFLKELHCDNIGTGDIFLKYNSNNNQPYYYLNIRAQCDLVREDKIGDTQLYCIKGTEIDWSSFDSSFGLFPEKTCNAIVSFINGGKIIEFKFRKLYIEKWKDLKDNRIGRLLSPHINRIQQKYSLYMQRQGVSRIPCGAFEIKEDNDHAKENVGYSTI